MPDPKFIPLPPRFAPSLPAEQAAEQFHEVMATRRTIRDFSDRPVSLRTIESLVRTAGTAPSGANKQPWRFVCVADPDLKKRIRAAAEAEEREFYATRATEAWLADLEPLGTDPTKEFLEVAPWLVVVFRLAKDDDGGQVYYPQESVGIAVGLFLAAAHHAGLVTLTHTPSPMGFLTEVLQRPKHEKPFVLIPVGYPKPEAMVPSFAMKKKPLDQIMVTFP